MLNLRFYTILVRKYIPTEGHKLKFGDIEYLKNANISMRVLL